MSLSFNTIRSESSSRRRSEAGSVSPVRPLVSAFLLAAAAVMAACAPQGPAAIAGLPLVFGELPPESSHAPDFPPAGVTVPLEPGEIRAAGFSYRSADASVDGASLTVLLADANSDGVFGVEDLWTIAQDAHLLAHPFTSETAREVGDFAWAAGRAWMLRLEGTAGRRGSLVAHDPDVTREEDGRRRRTYAADRAAPRAESPLVCLGGLQMLDPDGSGARAWPIRAEAGTEDFPEGGPSAERTERASPETVAGEEEDVTPPAPAQERISSRRAVLLYFTAPECEQCEDMERLVFPSREVAEAARETACWRVDADSRPDLLGTYRVGGVPAGVLFDPEGREVGRIEGYGGVGELAALLRRAQP